jgi:hypothetical protein
MLVKFASKLALVMALATGLAACSDDGSGPDGDDIPVVLNLAVANAPTPPAGRTVLCPEDQNSTTNGTTCPVVRWNGVTYWAFNFNENSISIIGYNSNQQEVKTIAEKENIKNVWAIEVNANTETILYRGAGGTTISVPWSELAIGEPL